VIKQLRFFLTIIAVAALCGMSSILLAQDNDKTAKKQDSADGSANQGTTELKKSEGTNTKSDPKATPAPGSTIQTPAGFRVGIEDEIAIAVWHEPELSQVVVVRPDGMITLPLLNDLKVAGLTTEEVQALVMEKLKPFVNDPQVTVSIKTVKSRKVSLVGNVVKQGVYPLNGRLTVLELLAEAGGLGPFAKSKSIYILRKEAGEEVRLPFNYKKAVSGKGDNPELMAGDMVVVP